MAATLEVSELGRQFATGRPAVDGVSFTVPAGEIVVLLGPSGCGKTTTLRCVAGLEHPTGGAIGSAAGVVSSPAARHHGAAARRDIGMVFQSYAVWPHMTVRAERGLSAQAPRRLARRGRRAWSTEALELVGLSEYVDRPVTALSGGQMQRVALARSLVYQPQLLLLDEPLSNLDAKLRLRLRDDLRRILKPTGMTALYVTHDQAEAVVLGDRIGVMRDGKLLQMARPTRSTTARPICSSPTSPAPRTSLPARWSSATARSAWSTSATAGAARRRCCSRSRRATRCASRCARRASRSAADGANAFAARVIDRRYQGTQTVYDIELFGAARGARARHRGAPRGRRGDAGVAAA